MGIKLREKQIEEYLESIEASGCTPRTAESYRRSLTRLCRFLNEDKYINAGTLAAWQNDMLESGYSAKTVNICMSAANGLMRYLGRLEFQAGRLPEEEYIPPELTRTEYLRLLSAARMMEKERIYLLVKVFGSVGLSVSDLKSLTAETVRAGRIVLPSETLYIPIVLREELLRFMREEGISSGPVFLTREGKPQNRSAITKMLKTLCRDARIPEEKVTPRCLRKLCKTTHAGIEESFSSLVEQAYDRLLEKEERVVGWRE